MVFNENTLTVLKNFAAINPGLEIQPGNVLRTVSPIKSIGAEAVLDQEFESYAAIYDLSRFISTFSLMGENADVEFMDDHFLVKGGNRKIRYFFSNKNVFVRPSETGFKTPKEVAKVDVSWDNLQSVIKATSYLGLPEVAFISNGETITLSALNSKDKSSNSFDVHLSDTATDQFQMIINSENLKLLPNDYEVLLCKEGLANFIGNNVKYWVSLEYHSS